MNEQTKIGIAIVHCITKSNGAGFDIVYKTDDGKWANLVDDTGDVFRHLKVNNGAIIRMIKFTTDGWYLCSMKPIVGRDDEYRASWIFFPSDINVEPKDIKNIMEEAELNISRKEFDVSALNTITTKYTDHIIGIPKYNIWATPIGYAIRYTDGTNPSLFDVFGKIYQKEFTRFSWVILMKKEDVDVRENSVSDITSQPLISSKIIQPISDEKFGFNAYVNNQLFTFPQRVSDNETIKIKWRRSGFAPIDKVGNSPDQLSIKEDDIYRVIYKSQIKVRDLYDRPLRVASAVNIIHGKWDDKNQCWFVPEKRISQVTITVDARGFEPHPIDIIDLGQKAVNEDIIIKLKEEVHTYNFRIKSSDGNIEFTRTFNTKISDNYTPLEGYKMRKPIVEANKGFIDLVFDSTNNQRPYQNGGKSTGNRKEYGNGQSGTPSISERGSQGHQETNHHGRTLDWSLVGKVFGIAILSFAVVFGVYWFFFKEESNSKHPYTDDYQKTGQEQTVTEDNNQTTGEDYSAAIQYLEQKTKFKRDEMESTGGLAGLWDLLNTYNFQAINDFVNQNPELKRSQRICGILNIIKKNPQISGKYCGDNDFEITVSAYINKLNNSLNPQPQNGNSSNNTQQNTNPSAHNKPVNNPAGNISTGTSTKNNSQTSSDNS